LLQLLVSLCTSLVTPFAFVWLWHTVDFATIRFPLVVPSPAVTPGSLACSHPWFPRLQSPLVPSPAVTPGSLACSHPWFPRLQSPLVPSPAVTPGSLSCSHP
jgi:hypothetical protein